MTTAREKAIERLAARFYDAMMAMQFSQWPPFEGAFAAGQVDARDARESAEKAFADLSLVAIDPALVEALHAARPNDQVCVECGATLPTDRGVSRLSCRRLDMTHVWQRTTERAEQTILHAVLAQLRGGR